MKQIWVLFFAVAIAATGFAQEPAKKSKSEEASAWAEKLDDAFGKHLRAEYQKYQAEMAKKIEEAKENGKAMPAMSMRPTLDLGDFPAKFSAAAKKYEGTDDAIQFLMMSLQSGQFAKDKSHAKTALDTLTSSHLTSKKIGPLYQMSGYIGSSILGDKKDYSWIADRIKKENKHRSIQALVLYNDVQQALNKAALDSKEYANARKVAMQSAELTDDEELKSRILGTIRRRESFGNGALAPDIAGVDLDGVAFKLSDYQGKIVFLDFWGDW